MRPNSATSGAALQWRLWLALLLLAGCNLATEQAVVVTVTTLPAPTATKPAPNAGAVMDGICFAAAQDAAGRLFVLRNAGELEDFYRQADNSRLCRRPVRRGAFDFSGGRVLAGLWSATRGCRAGHEVVAWERDEQARRIRLQLRLWREGDCDYELVQPWWMALEGASGHEIVIEVLP